MDMTLAQLLASLVPSGSKDVAGLIFSAVFMIVIGYGVLFACKPRGKH